MNIIVIFAAFAALNVLLVALVASRYERELADAEARAKAGEPGIPLQERADAVASAHQASLDNLKRLRAVPDEERRRLWLSVRDACDAEIQDVHAAMQAGVA
ncbi:hypothetical protein [Pseudoxanthomonas mexicana]